MLATKMIRVVSPVNIATGILCLLAALAVLGGFIIVNERVLCAALAAAGLTLVCTGVRDATAEPEQAGEKV